jgi:ABC-type amino acid transport substrate-binding protein
LPLRAEPVSYFYSDLPPYEYSNAAGVAEGIGIDKVKKVLLSAGFQPAFQFYSVSRGLNALQHDIDFSAVVAPTAEQRQQLKVSAAPIYLAEIGVVRLRNTKPLNTLEQLKQYPYVALSDTRFAYLQQRPALAGINANRYDIANQQDAYRLLISGRYDYYLCYHASNLPLSNPLLVFDSLEQIPVYLVLSKKNPDVDRLMQRVDQAMAKL